MKRQIANCNCDAGVTSRVLWGSVLDPVLCNILISNTEEMTYALLVTFASETRIGGPTNDRASQLLRLTLVT